MVPGPAAAGGINGQLVQLYRPTTEVAYFAGVGAAAMATSIVMHLISPWIQRRTGGER
ncbi:hypothetical protein AB0I49_11435 [Streptomyces sp. NPDC050617]|uniref:hypothetical protein n=1 Tax=Streptomyces sp. NPDC050617 TaxID=3154628 RepID=UPI0034194F00